MCTNSHMLSMFNTYIRLGRIKSLNMFKHIQNVLCILPAVKHYSSHTHTIHNTILQLHVLSTCIIYFNYDRV